MFDQAQNLITTYLNPFAGLGIFKLVLFVIGGIALGALLIAGGSALSILSQLTTLLVKVLGLLIDLVVWYIQNWWLGAKALAHNLIVLFVVAPLIVYAALHTYAHMNTKHKNIIKELHDQYTFVPKPKLAPRESNYPTIKPSEPIKRKWFPKPIPKKPTPVKKPVSKPVDKHKDVKNLPTIFD